MEVKREDLKAFLILTRSALSNLCYSQGDIDIVDEKVRDLKAELSELEEKLNGLLAEKVRMQSTIDAYEAANNVLALVEAGETVVINVTN